MFNSSCPNCQSPEYEPVLSRSGYEIVRCRHCQLQYLNPMPKPEAILAYYQDPEYYTGKSEGYHDYMGMAKVFLPLAERRLAQIEAAIPGAVGQRHILDIGCAAGFFLEKAREQGWQIAGVEVAAEMAQYAQQRLGIPIYSSVDEIDAQRPIFEAITLWEVIEHLPEPHHILQQLFHLLKPGGVLALSTPNTGHWQAVKAPNEWAAYCPPAHLLYFTHSSLQMMLKKAGFEVIAVQGTGPRPRLPLFVERIFEPIQQGLAHGDTPFWFLSLYSWRAVRLLALLRDRLLATKDDTMMTLEALAYKPIL
jgi:2-polyprenyl-3-methyl-5-hydroxy-6-metoxy-1,4-benzoquinol methylase